MAKKEEKKLQDEELDKVTGGATKDTLVVETERTCSKCGSKNISSETTGSGCDKTTTYTCKDCGHTW